MITLRPVARAMRARARGSRPIVFGVGSTTVRPPACLNSKISSWATCSSRSCKLSRLALKFWRTQPRLARLTGSHARPLSLAAAGSANITLKSIKRCSCGGVTAHALGDGVGEPLDVLFLVGDEQRHVGRAPERLRVTADGGAVLVEDLALPPQHAGAAPAVPMVGVLGHDAQGDALPAAAD